MNYIDASCYILCGGSGKRLYPIISDKNPKYDYNIKSISQTSLGESTLDNAIIRSIKIFDDITLISKVDHEKTIQKYLTRYSKLNSLFEKNPKNTMMAVVCAANHAISTRGDDAVIVVMPSDQIIDLEFLFREAMHDGVMHVKNTRKTLLLGVDNIDFDTRLYGCIFYNNNNSIDNIYSVSKFNEKPQENVNGRNFLTNSGIFIIPAKEFLKDISQMYNDINVEYDKNIVIYKEIAPDISFDYGFLNVTNPENLNVIKVSFDFIDIGSCNVMCHNLRDENGNILIGNITAHNIKNSYIVNNSSKNISVSDLQNVAIRIEDDGSIVISENKNL